MDDTPAPKPAAIETADDLPLAPASRARPDIIGNLVRHGHSEAEVWDLVVPKRTLARRRAQNELLTVEETDKAFRGWQNDAALTRGLGDRWLRENQNALLRVPTAIVPFAWNWLLNPAHADARHVRIAETVRAAFDPKLFKG